MKFYNFSRKFWQVAALSLTFLGGGPKISLGVPGPLGTAPDCLAIPHATDQN